MKTNDTEITNPCPRCKIRPKSRNNSSYCLECSRIKNKHQREDNLEKYLKREALYRKNNPEKERMRHSKYNKDPKNRKKLRKANKIYAKNNQERVHELERFYRLERQYGLTKQQYYDLWIYQGGICPICNKPLKDPFKMNKPVRKIDQVDLDHNHHTGIIRGFVHHLCNALLNNCEDDPERLRNAIKYLESDGVNIKPKKLGTRSIGSEKKEKKNRKIENQWTKKS